MRAPITLSVLLLGAILLVLAGTAGAATAQQRTPFGVPAAGPSAAAPVATGAQQAPSVWSRFRIWVQTTQHTLQRQLAGAVRGLKGGDRFAAAWLLVGLSFLYGVVHAVGPGHGKAVISSYVLANERTVRRGVLLSFLASATQAVSAILLVGVLAILLNASGMGIKHAVGWLEVASYALVALIGAWMLTTRIRTSLRSGETVVHRHRHHHGNEHGPAAPRHRGEGCCGHSHIPDPGALEGAWSLRKMAAIVLAVGVRPCTGAIVVLVFALAHGLFLAGVGATLAMSFGTAVTVSALAVLAVGSKHLAVRLANGDGAWTTRIQSAASYTGSTLVLLFGAVLFWASLGPARPF